MRGGHKVDLEVKGILPSVKPQTDFVQILLENLELDQCAGALRRRVRLDYCMEFPQQQLNAFEFFSELEGCRIVESVDGSGVLNEVVNADLILLLVLNELLDGLVVAQHL